LDTFQAVEFEVVQAKDTGRVTFLNSRIPYAGAFYVAIFPDDYGAFPEPPAVYLAGRCIVVQGTIETYRGAPQIVLRHPDDLRILEDPPAPMSSDAPSAPRRPRGAR
jgi:micrococcal nuclease